MVRERLPINIVHAENAHAQATNRTRNTVAIKLKLLEARTLDICPGIHFNAIDAREEIVLAHVIVRNCMSIPLKTSRNTPTINRNKVLPPHSQLSHPLLSHGIF